MLTDACPIYLMQSSVMIDGIGAKYRLQDEAKELTKVNLFNGLEREEIRTITNLGARRLFKPSDFVMQVDEAARHLFLVVRGAVDFSVLTSEGSKLLLRRMAPGDIFGVATFLLEPHGYMGTTQAVSDSEMLVWEHRVVQQLANRYSRLPQNALRAVLGYLAEYTKRHIAIVSSSAEERLACALTELGARTGRIFARGVEVSVKNEDLASLADISYFTVSRLLSQWARKGALEKKRGTVLIRSPEGLIA